MRVQQGTAFSAVLFWIDLLRSSIEENDQLYFVYGRIEIKYLFSWLLQNNLLGVKMLFEIQKSRLFYLNNTSPPEW